MLFSDAIKAVINGKYIRRPRWNANDGYLALLSGMPYVWKILTMPNPNAGTYPFPLEDFLADDWEASEPGHNSDVIVQPVDITMDEAA